MTQTFNQNEIMEKNWRQKFFGANTSLSSWMRFWVTKKYWYSQSARFMIRSGTYGQYLLSKKLRRIFLYGLLAAAILIILAGVIIGSAAYKNPTSALAVWVGIAPKPGMLGGLIDTILNAIVQAILRIMWMIFIYPFVRLSMGGETVFKWMGLANLIVAFVNDKSVSTIFILFTSIGSFLVIVMLAFAGLQISMNKNTQEGQERIRSMPKNIAYAILLLMLALFAFTMLNSLLNYLVMAILNLSPNGAQSIPLYIYNCSFNDGIHHETYIPHWPPSDFEMTVGVIGQVEALLILVFLNLTMFSSILELVILYGSSWLQLGSVASGDTVKFNMLLASAKKSFLTIVSLYLGYLLFQIFMGLASAVAYAAHFTDLWAFQFFMIVVFFALFRIIKWLPDYMNTIFEGSGAQGMNSSEALGRTTSAGKKTAKVGTKVASPSKNASRAKTASKARHPVGNLKQWWNKGKFKKPIKKD